MLHTTTINKRKDFALRRGESGTQAIRSSDDDDFVEVENSDEDFNLTFARAQL